jgi:predicted DNA-binding transcriptional regulator AlpA
MSTPTSTPNNNPGDSASLLSRAKIAQIADCCTRTVIRAEQRGDLNPIRLGPKLVRYDTREVMAWIQRCKSQQ